ncbi:hypothetical protein [Dehalococcoides mccartyi]|uniref:hypothetical protein n=1 Tax=Dehalococcoides mccartyi TaxID=61435 RepID=UPI0003C83D5B|nr:hypothetical protein [Dehalococcoides mccartyi]AHB13471.1 hypothetical protein GY50_0690 [Dehalococcoides mccartyi GY50]
MDESKEKADQPKEQNRICNKCGFENIPGSTECTKCKSTQFAPPWVKAKRLLTRQASIEITTSNPQYGPVQERITLSKWWRGEKPSLRDSSFHIVSPEQWETIERVINEEMLPLIGWRTEGDHSARLKESLQSGQGIEDAVSDLLRQRPELLSRLLKSLDAVGLGNQEISGTVEILAQLAALMTNSTSRFRETFINLLQTLPKQSTKSLEDLESLLQSWSLQQVTSVAQIVRSRLSTLELFKNRVMDEQTFEIIGDNSIHRILEKAMWMIDERYWLLQSNATLRKLIGEKMSELDKKQFGKKRPDFVCGSIEGRLIIVELKRPSKTLTIDDINQLETYLTLAEEYSQYTSFEAYLVGNNKDSDLIRRMKHRSNIYRVRTYSDLIDDTEKRYREYFQLLEKTNE